MMVSRRVSSVIACFAASIVMGAAAMAQPASPAEQIKARQDHYKAMATSMKTIGDQLKAGTLDRAAMTAAAQNIATLSRQIPTWFPKGTGPEAGVDTLAKPEIWARPDEFAADAANLPPEADKLVQVVAAGDAAAIGAQLKATGAVCGACHKPFRTPPPQ
jgi:cytochrome c556